MLSSSTSAPSWRGGERLDEPAVVAAQDGRPTVGCPSDSSARPTARASHASCELGPGQRAALVDQARCRRGARLAASEKPVVAVAP